MYSEDLKVGEGSRPVCRDHLRGNCHRGLYCKYQHPDVDKGDGFQFFSDTKQNSRFHGEDLKEGESSRPICRDHLRGNCGRGLYCKFQHPDVDNRDGFQLFSDTKQNSQFQGEDLKEGEGWAPVCRYYLRGNCGRGLDCRFHHPDVDKHDGFQFFSDTEQNSRFPGGNSDGDSSGCERYSGGSEQKREFCIKFTEGWCFKGSSCKEFHSYHEYATSVYYHGGTMATTTVTRGEGTFRNMKTHSRTSDTCSHAEEKSVDLGTDSLTEDIPVGSNLTSSSKCAVESMTEEVADTSSRKVPVCTLERTSVDHENVMSVSEVINSSVQIIDDVSDNGLLHGNADISCSLQVSRSLDNVVLKSRKKLLVLDVDGLLADIVAVFPARFKPDYKLKGEGVFKRPFCDGFLKFCFEKFDVGIWSSRTKENVAAVVGFLMKNTGNKLLFHWDHSHCTKTDEKPLVLKELKKLWQNAENDLPWNKGSYDESNTILLDASPCSGLSNPPYTAVYPMPYSFEHVNDRSLGPGGDLRIYLERLTEAEDVQNFIRIYPFS